MCTFGSQLASLQRKLTSNPGSFPSPSPRQVLPSPSVLGAVPVVAVEAAVVPLAGGVVSEVASEAVEVLLAAVEASVVAAAVVEAAVSLAVEVVVARVVVSVAGEASPGRSYYLLTAFGGLGALQDIYFLVHSDPIAAFRVQDCRPY